MKSKNVVLGIAVFILVGVIALVILMVIGGNDIVLKKAKTSSSVDKINMEINVDNGDEKIDWSKYQTKDIILSESLVINEGGIYKLSGTLNNGYIKVNTQDNVKLEFNNVSITNMSGPAVYIEKAEDIVINLLDGTVNTLVDGNTYVGFDQNVNGAIYSEDDMTFEGTGTLNVTSNFEDAIVSKNDLKFVDGKYIINSSDDGIRGKDSVYIKGGSFQIEAKGNGIKTTNTKDTNKGFIRIKDGEFSINSELDAIQAETKLLIQDGKYSIITGGGSSNSSSDDSWGNWGNRSGRTSKGASTNSAKGLKAKDNLVIEKGDFTFNTSDDAIHSKKSLGIKEVNININSGDDGIHADTELIVDNGNINIAKSLEGIEAANVVINSGNISIISDDDGINVAGGRDSSSVNGRRGQNEFNKTDVNQLVINDGKIHVNSSGDGIDVNGSIYINGGSLVVEGPEDDGNGALDYDVELIINGGELITSGSGGMAQSISDNSKQYGVMINFHEQIKDDKTVLIVDKDNKEIISYSSSKTYSSLVVSSKKLTKGNYKVKVDGEEIENFTIDKISTIVGEMSRPSMKRR